MDRISEWLIDHWYIPAILVGAVLAIFHKMVGVVVMVIGILLIAITIFTIFRPVFRRIRDWVSDEIVLFRNPGYRRTALRRIGIVIGALVLIRLVGWGIWGSTNNPHAEKVADGLTFGTKWVGNARVNYLEVDMLKVRPVVLTAHPTSVGKVELATLTQGCLAAVNGDFFDEGGPQGLCITEEARVTAANQTRAALSFEGVFAEINLFRFSTDCRVTVNGVPHPVRRSYNVMYTPGDVGVYNRFRGIASGAGICKELWQARVRLHHIGETDSSGEMTEIVRNPTRNLIPKDGEIIIVAGNEDLAGYGPVDWAKETWDEFAPVNIHLTVSPIPGDQVISGGPEIIRMGQFFAPITDNRKFCISKTGRTAVGISESGTKLLVVSVEGPPKWLERHAPISVNAKLFLRGLISKGILATGLGLTRVSEGMSVAELTRMMMEEEVMGERIWSALNLDGGSSTTMTVGDKYVTRPMEGRQPALATALGFKER